MRNRKCIVNGIKVLIFITNPLSVNFITFNVFDFETHHIYFYTLKNEL